MSRGIYKIALSIDGRCYVGSAVNIERRWSQHRHALNRGTHYNARLQNAWKKYGASAFTFSVVEEVLEATELVATEQRYIDTLKPFYNIAPRAGSQLGYKHTAEAREQARLRMLGSKLREGKPFSTEARDRLSEQRRAKGHSPAQHAHLLHLQEHNRQTRIPKPKLPKKPRYSPKGTTHTVAARERMSKAKMGNASRTGLPHSMSSREKIAASVKLSWDKRRNQQ